MNAAQPEAAPAGAKNAGPARSYDAFISYSHESDAVFAPVLQRGLQHLGKAWNRRRAIEVFRDESSLAASPGLWPSITAALEASRWLVVLASPESARSEWVGREISHWVASKGTEYLLVVVTSGTLIWDDATTQISPASTAWNAGLSAVFSAEPKYVDMAWARGNAELSLRNARFRDQVATLVAAIRDVPKEEIEGEDVRQQRRTRRIVQTVIATLTVLVLLASVLAVVANVQRDRAVRQENIALSRQLAAEGLNIDSESPVAARRLALAAWRIFPTQQAALLLQDLTSEQQAQGLLPADPNIVFGVAFNPGGRLLASAGGNGTVRLWNTMTDQPVGRALRAESLAQSFKGVIGGQRGGIHAVAFSPDGKLLASADSDGTVRFWNPRTGRPAGRPLYARTDVYGMAFSPDGTTLATANFDGTVRLWDLAARREIGQPLLADPGQDGRAYAVAFSPDGKLLASADGDGTVRLWNPGTGQPVGRPLRAASDVTPIWAVAFSPNGKLLASSDSSGSVQLWDPVTGKPVGTPLSVARQAVGAYGLAFSPDSNLLATAGSDDTVRLWDTATGKPIGAPMRADMSQLTAFSGISGVSGVRGVAFSPDGTLLAAANGNGGIQLWSTATGQPAGSALGRADTQAITFSAGSRLMATANSNGTVRLWDPVTGRPLGMLRAHGGPLRDVSVNAIAFSPGGKLVAGAARNGTVQVWHSVTGAPVGTPLNAATDKAGVWSLAFRPHGQILATGNGNGTVGLWNPATGRQVSAPLQADISVSSSALAFSPDGQLLASADQDGTVRLWNPATGRLTRVLGVGSHTTIVWAVAFSPDGKMLASGDDNGWIRFWNPTTGRQIGTPVRGATSLTAGVGSIAFSPRGELLASSDGATVRFWDPRTGRSLGQPITISGSPIDQIAFGLHGSLLAAAGDDLPVRLWQMSLFTDPYSALCTEVGAPTRQEWNEYAAGATQPPAC
jgi:WD40 repeat protein